MVSHVKLQYYRHHYCLVCMTGSLGCRWHRYKQSTRDSRKRDLLMFSLLTATFLLSVYLLYFVLIAKNDFDSFNWYFYQELDGWFPIYTVLLVVVCILFTYLFILMCLSLCHFLHGHQVYIHKAHIVVIFIILAMMIGVVVSIQELWKEEWAVLWLSLKVFGPYLQIGAVALMTLMSWFIARQWYTLSSSCLQLFWLMVYMAVMAGLYISPLFINSPCVIMISELPKRPNLIAHRGASGVAPENTIAAFQIANEFDVYGYETDVRISLDGVPFLLHDSNFHRTTNIAKVFPNLKNQQASKFNISQIKQLNAGTWFLENDPMGSVGGLSHARKQRYRNQSVPTLEQLIRLANSSNKVVLFDLFQPAEDHPYHNQTVNQTLQAITNGGIPSERIWWLTDAENPTNPGRFVLGSRGYYPSSVLLRNNISLINAQSNELSSENIQEYRQNNISTVIYLVNTKWFFSLYWCMGVSAVATDNCHVLQELEEPVFHFSPRNYLILWITVDIMSALLVITGFIVHRILSSGSKYSPERMAITTAEHNIPKTSSSSHRKSRRQMKEKLIMRDVTADFYEDEEAPEDYGIESNYTVQSTDGRDMVRSFQIQRTNGYQRNVDVEINKIV